MSVAGSNKTDAAPLYLNSGLSGRAATDLAQQLYVVLNSRLPVRVNVLSERPEGSLVNPLRPDQDVVGTINTSSGPLGAHRRTRGRGRSRTCVALFPGDVAGHPTCVQGNKSRHRRPIPSVVPDRSARLRHSPLRLAGGPRCTSAAVPAAGAADRRGPPAARDLAADVRQAGRHCDQRHSRIRSAVDHGRVDSCVRSQRGPAADGAAVLGAGSRRAGDYRRRVAAPDVRPLR